MKPGLVTTHLFFISMNFILINLYKEIVYSSLSSSNSQGSNALSASRAPYLRALGAKKPSPTSLNLVSVCFANTVITVTLYS